MRTAKDFLKQLTKNGLYIILFLCISAIGIAGYVMYRTKAPEVPVNQIIEEIPKPAVKEEYVAVEIPQVPVAKTDESNIEKKNRICNCDKCRR